MKQLNKISTRSLYIIAFAVLLILVGSFTSLVSATYYKLFLTTTIIVTLLALWLDTFKKFRRFTMAVIAIILLLVIALQTSFVQNWATGIATKKLAKALGTEVRIKNISLSLFDKVNLEGTLIRDKQKDTLLYAGQLRVRITDWFFVKDQSKLELKFIGLEDAVVKLQRKDSVWNYQFIADYFASPKAKKDTSKGIEINLRKADLKNVVFIQNDLWVGEKITANIGSLLLDAEDLKFNQKVFHVNSLQLEKPYVRIDDFPELRPDSLKPKEINDPNDTTLRFNLGISFMVNNLSINNGTFIDETSQSKPLKGFDGEHVQLTQLKGTFKDFSFVNDTLKAKMDISAKERCGFELKRLKTNLRITPQIIELAKLDLQTNRSRLGDHYSMKFSHFKNDFKNYMTDVFMDARFKNTKVNSDDIAFFAPDLKTWKKEVFVSGNFLGTVSDFHIKNFFIHSGGTTNIAGDLAMKGLPNIDKTVINFNQGYIKTNNVDMGIVIPALRRMNNPNLAALGNVLFRGNFNGTINNFKTVGVISTNIGGVDANVAMTFPKKGEPTYNGTLTTNRFNLGKFINSSDLGLISFKGKVKGSSFDLMKMKSSLDGAFSLLEFKGYPYTNIITTGTFLKQYFNGELKIDDPNLDFTSTIEIDMSKEEPSFNILGDLVKSNLQNIHLTPKDKYELTGLFDLNFTGSNIDAFLGSVKILNANLTKDNNRLSFDSLVVTAVDSGTGKTLTASSNEFTATVTGKQYRILDLPVAFQTYLNHYYPTYFAAPVEKLKDQDFSVSFTTKDFESYTKLIDTNLTGFSNASLTGTVNTEKNQFTLLASVPSFSYKNYHVSDAFFKGEGTIDTLILNGDVANVRIGDSLNFPNSIVSIQSSNDHSAISIKTKADNTLNEASLNANVYTLPDGVRINFKPSEFVINDKRWNLEKEGEIVVRKHFVSAENVKFSQGFQEIRVETEMSEVNNANNLVVRLKNVVLGDLTSLVVKNPRMEGIANGEIRLNDFYGQFNAEATIKAEQFRLDNDSIGLVNIKSSYDSKTGKIPFAIQSPNDNYKFKTEGYYNLKDSTNKALYVNTQLENSGIGIVQRFIGDIFSDLSGKATGNLIVSGDPSSLNLSGKIKLINGGLKVNFTQVYYNIDSANIAFEPDGIDFGQFTIRDKYDNKGTVGGKLYEQNFKNMVFDFNLNTNKLLLIDSKAKDNKQFYGKAIGKASLSLKGSESNARMAILAESNDSSNISIKTSSGKESSDADFIVFKQYGTELVSETQKSNFDLTVDLDISTNRLVNINVILDELTGDVIEARGTGRLKIVAGTTAPLTIKGRYNIDFGQYNFNFQSFIKKPFQMRNADNYIEWNGDPYNATIRIDAQYTATRVSIADLISNQQVSGLNSNTKSFRDDVYVVAHLRDKLVKPSITFSLDFPQNNPVKNDPVFSEFISRIESDQNEMLAQATSLIVFNSFAPYGKGFLGEGNNNAINMLGVNTITQLLTKQVNKAVTGFLYKLTKDKSIRFDIGASAYSNSSIIDQATGITASNNGRIDRSVVNFKFGKSFFNDKLIVNLGGDFDFSLNNSSNITNGNFQWLPDFNVEYILTGDNTSKQRLSLIGFSKNSLELNAGSLGRRSRQGLSITYKRDFERLFGNKDDGFIRVKPPKDAAPKPVDTSGIKNTASGG